MQGVVHVWVAIVICAVVALLTGYLMGRSSRSKVQQQLETRLDTLEKSVLDLVRGQATISSFLGSVNNLSVLVSELKAKYDEMKSTEEKLSYERDKRFQESIEAIRREISAFLMQQEKTREEIERRRDEELKNMKRVMDDFVRTIYGTKSRGQVGEVLLNELLSDSIRDGTVVKDLRIGSMVVEFAWSLGDGKYVPIDSKFPDLASLVEEFENAKDQNEREERKKQIVQKIQREIENVKKYQSQPNTTDSCIMVVPAAVIEIAPELVAEAKKQNVFLCTHRELLTVVHFLEARHSMMKRDEMGRYKQVLQTLSNLVEQIEDRTNSLDRALKQLTNASNEIRNLLSQVRSNLSVVSLCDKQGSA